MHKLGVGIMPLILGSVGFFPRISVSQELSNTIPAVPTTRILAFGTLVAPLSEEQRKSIMSQEVPDTVRLYLGGKIDQWYVRTDGKGVVFILNGNSVDDARAMLDQLPLGRAKLMTFEFFALGPLSPLGLLLNPHQ